MESLWQFWIDVGGTFTDCLGVSPDGQEHLTKVLSSGATKGTIQQWLSPSSFTLPHRNGDGEDFWSGAAIRFFDSSGTQIAENVVEVYDDSSGEFYCESVLPDALRETSVTVELDLQLHAPIMAIRRILKLGPSSSLPTCRVHLGTTRGTNALLTRTGARTAFVTSKGFRDLLRIGDQARPHLFQLDIEKPHPLFEHSVELNERTLADGTVEHSPEDGETRLVLSELLAAGIESIAVCFVHGYRFPENEKIVGQIAREIGFKDVRLSHEVAPLIKMLNRGETTVLDAYLNPVIGSYLDEIQQQLPTDSQLRLMTSSGGLVERDRFSGKDSVLSGPAGGVVGAARVAQAAGFERVLTFDMGGTSTDVGRFDGDFQLEYETFKAGTRIVSPMMAIETVAAGGGSVCRFDGAKLTVGPESATSDPGPACYGNGGPMTVTDINLFLGRIVKDQFPFALNTDAVEARLQEIRDQMFAAGFEITLTDLAIGFLKIANNNMAAAIRIVSIAKGYDPGDYALVSFGGAGSQHCCSLASTLGIERIVDHPQGSILSAVGIRLADQIGSRVRSVLQTLDKASLATARKLMAEMASEIRDELANEVGDNVEIELQNSLDLRYMGTDSFETIAESESGFHDQFSQVHQQRYGYTQDRPLEIVAARCTGRVRGNRLKPTQRPSDTTVAKSTEQQPMLVPIANAPEQYQQQLVPVFDRDQLNTDNQIVGPAIIFNPLSSTIVDPGWIATRLDDGQLLIERDGSAMTDGETLNAESKTELPAELPVDPVELEIFNNHFSTIARQMGVSLQNTSTSVNVKERLDFSCALFSDQGQLIVNAPHIPVHLGAMGQTVQATIQDNRVVRPGDVFATNDPYRGGSHLPDITVVTPVFVDQVDSPVFWVASRSHHAEIGGKSPGSMPADATILAEEGVLIQNFKLLDGGVERFEALRELLTTAEYPSRMPDENLVDLAAQVAANRVGEQDLLALVDRHGLEKVHAYMQHIQDAAEVKARAALAQINDGVYRFGDTMDDGAKIEVAITIDGDHAVIDFSGTDPVRAGNLNANSAIVSAAAMYVMRLLISDEIPLNEGVMKPLEIYLPECFLNPAPADEPGQSPAIVGGNVETSQRVVDVLLGALGLAAASCGTMNNWLMGDETFGYYETVGGGSGATKNQAGASAVHTHMTNTRLTDPEILETRYPVILREFAVRANSGGEGQQQGGDGIHRQVEFLRPLTLSLLTSRRETEPFGMDGGEAGRPGRNILWEVATGEPKYLPSQCEVQIQPGDHLVLMTPGGGGFGKKPK